MTESSHENTNAGCLHLHQKIKWWESSWPFSDIDEKSEVRVQFAWKCQTNDVCSDLGATKIEFVHGGSIEPWIASRRNKRGGYLNHLATWVPVAIRRFESGIEFEHDRWFAVDPVMARWLESKEMFTHYNDELSRELGCKWTKIGTVRLQNINIDHFARGKYVMKT